MENSDTGIIIQARTCSTRLPNKIIKSFYKNKTIFEILINKLRKCNIPIIVATTNNVKDDIICKKCDELKVQYYRGSENNVLQRFIDTATHYNIQTIIRVCSDNPFIDETSINKLINNFNKLQEKPDYYSYTLDGSKSVIQEHIGTFTELVTLQTLNKVNGLTNKKLYQEHVTNYIYDHRNNFNIILEKPPQYLYKNQLQDKVRLTVDTKKDFELLSCLYLEVIEQYGNFFTLENIFEYLAKNKEKFVHNMKLLILNNPK